MSDMKISGMAIRYSQFVPRLYNLCLALGFRRGHIMPSRAFCSDESQGYPTILIAQHFGTFPFDHGRAVALRPVVLDIAAVVSPQPDGLRLD